MSLPSSPPDRSRSSSSPGGRLRFWSASRAALVGVALVLPAVILQLAVGCGEGGDPGGAGGSGSTGSVEPDSTTGVGGIDADATVPDSQPDVKPPTFEELCGEGECTPGELPDECAPAGELPRGCHVVAGSAGKPRSDCAAVGTGETDAPCQQAADCIAGDVCIPTEASRDQGYSGVCRPYCCGDIEACPDQSFCAPRPRIDEEDLEVPVCVPVAPCELLADGACPPGLTCGVVRTDGTTSCVEAGSGTLCEACPCAEGLVCANHTGLCQKLCHTEGAGDECGAGFCQGGSAEYPAGIGVCVGGENACDE